MTEKWTLREYDKNGIEEVFICPFSNLFDFVSSYLQLAEHIGGAKENNRKIKEIKKYFLNGSFSGNIQKPSDECCFGKMERFILQLVKNRMNTPTLWMDFNRDCLDDLLKQDFFDEYNRVRKNEKNLDYYNIELYVFAKLQVLACRDLPEKETYNIWKLWCKEDLLQRIYECKFYEIISVIYELYGKDWFCHFKYRNSSFDPMLYKFAFYGIFSAYLTCKSSVKDIKDIIDDLEMLHEEFSLAAMATATNNNETNKKFLRDIIGLKKEIELNKDNEHYAYDLKSKIIGGSAETADIVPTNALICNLFSVARLVARKFVEPKIMKIFNTIAIDFKHIHPTVSNEDETVTKTTDALREAIKKIENKDLSPEKKEKQIAGVASAATGDNEEFDSGDALVNNALMYMSDKARDIVKGAWRLYRGNQDSCNYAVFMLATCVEGEFRRKILEPFRNDYKSFHKRISYCKDKNIRKTEKRLMGEKPFYFTLASFYYLGDILKSENYKNSTLIKIFAAKIGKNKDDLIRICDNISEKSIGKEKLTITKIRNDVAHGGYKFGIDKQCFDEVMERLFKKPMEIMLSIYKVGASFNEDRCDIAVKSDRNENEK